MNENENNFVGGQMSGLPLFEKDKPAQPRVESSRTASRKTDTHTPQTSVQTMVDDTMRLVRYQELAIGACFMREFKPNHYMTYTKTDEKAWDADYQVLIFKRHERLYLKPLSPEAKAVQDMIPVLEAETAAFFNRGAK